jgi:hypothetical protein
MERAIIHSNLIKQEIQPSDLIKEYKSLLEKDIKKWLSPESMQKVFCPVTGEQEIKQSFSKIGMEYHISHSLGNIYLSPQPSMKALKTFYLKSEAREFWHTQLWPKTKAMRRKKIILPQLEWAQEFIGQYCAQESLKLAEYFPNHWGYFLASKHIFPSDNYKMIDVLFDPVSAKESISENIGNEVPINSLDAALLFEALDRSPDPAGLLESVKQSLKPGGLCFITCLLSSGFEMQILGEKSDVFVPPERMNLFSFEGINRLIEKIDGFDIMEFSTPGVLDIPNVINKLEEVDNLSFFGYVFKLRDDPSMVVSFQDFLQRYRLGTFGRLVLRKK